MPSSFVPASIHTIECVCKEGVIEYRILLRVIHTNASGGKKMCQPQNARAGKGRKGNLALGESTHTLSNTRNVYGIQEDLRPHPPPRRSPHRPLLGTHIQMGLVLAGISDIERPVEGLSAFQSAGIRIHAS